MNSSTNRRGLIIAIIAVLAVICLCVLLAVVAAILFFVPVQRSLSQPALIGGLISLGVVLDQWQQKPWI